MLQRLHQMLKKTTAGLDTAMERLSTGLVINFARDDAVGLAIATRLDSEVQSYMASRNASRCSINA